MERRARFSGMTPDNSSEKIWKLLAEFTTAMLVTADENGVIRARPMAIAGIEKGEKIWFFSAQDTAKLHEISERTRVGVVCQKGQSVFLSLSGNATLTCDPKKVSELWRESLRLWFPDGKEDPGIVLIAVTPTRAEFWDHSGIKKVTYLWDAATAYLAGTALASREGEQHGVMDTNDATQAFR